MALDYAAALARTRACLMDAGAAIWTDADLSGSIRLAVQVAGLYGDTVYTLSGLDSAVATTLPAQLEGALIVGAAVYAASSRAVDRAEAFELAGESAQLALWVEQRRTEWLGFLSQYAAALNGAEEAARLDGLRTVAPALGVFSGWVDDFGERAG